jgi:hypothetical protein
MSQEAEEATGVRIEFLLCFKISGVRIESLLASLISPRNGKVSYYLYTKAELTYKTIVM